nr:MAG TPA: hypothetical protein [Caudoviricetes sp.]
MRWQGRLINTIQCRLYNTLWQEYCTTNPRHRIGVIFIPIFRRIGYGK